MSRSSSHVAVLFLSGFWFVEKFMNEFSFNFDSR